MKYFAIFFTLIGMSFAMTITHDISKRDVPHSEYGVPPPVNVEYGPPPAVAVEVPHEEYGVPAVHDTADCPQDGRWVDDVSNVVWWAGATGGDGGTSLTLPHEEYGPPQAVPVPAATVVQPLPTPVQVPTSVSAPFSGTQSLPIITHNAFF